MSDQVHMNMTVQEMHHLAEICAMTLSTLEPLKPELQQDSRYHEWQQLCISILEAARQIPQIAPQMAFNPSCGYWFFTPSYVQHSFYAQVITKSQDSIFWAEFVTRLADEIFGTQALSPIEQQQRSMYEQSLWDEVEQRGLSRFRIQA